MITGHLGKLMFKFDPEEYKKASDTDKVIIQTVLDNDWPFTSILYSQSKGEMPTKAAPSRPWVNCGWVTEWRSHPRIALKM